mmetsp:Transcript_26064/g.82741  ORF Transcript_26064/g.82741 Transcript_26064/m.82741 type:complete len:299 (+) Transcript_26064:281-1177(+)
MPSASTPAACHTPRSGGSASPDATASSRLVEAASAASQRATRTSAPLARSSKAAPPSATAPLREASKSADAPHPASHCAVTMPRPPVPPVRSCAPCSRGWPPACSEAAVASRGTRTAVPEHAISGSLRAAADERSVRRESCSDCPSRRTHPIGAAGASARAVRARPHAPVLASPGAPLPARGDSDSSQSGATPMDARSAARAQSSPESAAATDLPPKAATASDGDPAWTERPPPDGGAPIWSAETSIERGSGPASSNDCEAHCTWYMFRLVRRPSSQPTSKKPPTAPSMRAVGARDPS